MLQQHLQEKKSREGVTKVTVTLRGPAKQDTVMPELLEIMNKLGYF